MEQMLFSETNSANLFSLRHHWSFIRGWISLYYVRYLIYNIDLIGLTMHGLLHSLLQAYRDPATKLSDISRQSEKLCNNYCHLTNLHPWM